MRCKTCGRVVLSGVANKAHCWLRSQQCSDCHYLGNRYRPSYKYDD